ncbi:MAG TPA: S8 family serine peptidase, partial [Gemmatimonadales bacterium]|nr:S8 family serine peptidase [Gemmatimonadales bacterium]
MPIRRTPSSEPPEHPAGPPALTRERELIVIAEPAVGLRATAEGLSSVAGVDLSSLAEMLEAAGARMRPLFGASVERMRGDGRARVAAAGAEGIPAPDLSGYYRVDAPDEQLDEIAAELRSHPAVHAAYVKPPAEPAVVKTPIDTGRLKGATPTVVAAPPQLLNDMLPRAEEAPPVSPDFTARQGYLGAAPAGIDAQFAWTQQGGSGAGVKIIDVEGEWRFTHEDLVQNQGGLVAGTPPGNLGWRNHGTAVLGEFGGDRNSMGITGICPDANVRGISIFGGVGTAGAIRQAADALTPGDIILIELHRPGPRATGVGQQGFIAIEWWPDDFDAIRYAASRGVVVVEAAGNGAEDLDAAAYDMPAQGFPSDWSNPFRRGARDSGAILVGAGAPPPGTHGQNWGPDRSRLDFSNFGSAVDAQGWGREVTTAAYGDLQGGVDENAWYTDQFSGTSSASPIVVGALGCVQGNLRSRGLTPLTPTAARNLLRTTGSPQQDAPARPATQRVGSRPDLRQMITGGVVLSQPLHRYWNPQATDHFYTTNWNELGWGNYGWSYEGVQCYVFAEEVPGSVPLYRYWNPGAGDHFYTTNWNELENGRYGWALESIQGYVFPQPGPGDVPLYRYWNPSIGDHFYTTDWNELGWGRYGWSLEGVQCYVRTQAQPPAAATVEGLAGRLMGGVPSERMTAAFAPAPTQAAPIPASFAGAAGPMTGAVPASFMSSRASFATGPGAGAFEPAARAATFQTRRPSHAG